MKLKTLKDLEHGGYMYKGCVLIRHLQEEAIKWVKDIQPEALLNIEDVKKNMLVEWIMMFFNISEEELKGGVDDGKRN